MSDDDKLCVPTLVISDFFQFCFIILSHPLYFSYFIFFFPYFFKLFSFLFPLFLTTTFLFFLSFSTTHPFGHPHENENEMSPHFDIFFKLVFETCGFETPSPDFLEEEEEEVKNIILPIQEPNIISSENDEEEEEVKVITEKNYESENYYKDSEEMEMMKLKTRAAWRKTLACKLFEERNDVVVRDVFVNEEMDLLWEKYENEYSIESNSKKLDLKTLVNQSEEKEEEEEEEEEEESEGKICCLQALKFSTGKMRFGMGKNNGLVKISKAFKGFKLLVTKNGKNKRHS